MTVPKHDYRAGSVVHAPLRFRLVNDDDTPVLSPALALQHSLAQTTRQSPNFDDRYPTAFRLMFPVVVSFGLWAAILRSF